MATLSTDRNEIEARAELVRRALAEVIPRATVRWDNDRELGAFVVVVDAFPFFDQAEQLLVRRAFQLAGEPVACEACFMHDSYEVGIACVEGDCAAEAVP